MKKKQNLPKPMKCVYCGRALTIFNTHTDHIIPRKHGGEDASDNKLPICDTCNLHKNAKPPIKFLRELLKANGGHFYWNEIPDYKEESKQESLIQNYPVYYFFKGEVEGEEWKYYKPDDEWYIKLSVVKKKKIKILIDANLRFTLIMLRFKRPEIQEIIKWLDETTNLVPF